ncbi:hypothetical protein JMJ58_21065 (plasmid) [Haloterrigena salifodinae]|uniref:Uncharacterized protein n=1 Tax=Haloterrigena salifodinae TaxID=2675099 RepID=A0A8T8E6V5_9EURY|nr:hypothetical protein [Haloterrigena salifodinae]QRV17449.1 hypothetical protein JMJ58_21065 [Haloterrigena salifodinae]
MSEKRKDQTRRTVLKAVSTGSLSIFAMSSASANNRDNSVDTSFNPQNKEEVAKFIDSSFEYANIVRERSKDTPRAEEKIKSERDRILDRLTEKQLKAIERFWDEEIGMEQERRITNLNTESLGVQSASTQDIDAWELSSFEETVSANVKVPIVDKSFDAIEYTHSVEWEHKAGEGVRAISSTGSGSGDRFTLAKWSYEGDEDEEITIRQDGNFFNSDLTGVFDRCVLTGLSFTCTTTDRLYTRVSGNWSGDGNLTRHELR